ncbi:MAG: hypothetical protein MJ102_02320 [Clostridia bacterium]|nr:hypothetical protein [Clostridia bacterium]
MGSVFKKQNEIVSDTETGGRKAFIYRYIIISVIFVLVCILYIVNIGRIQINGTTAVNKESTENYTTRKAAIQAVRGEIFDRNGVPLVTNEYSYSLVFDYNAMANTHMGQNRAILAVLSVIDEMKLNDLAPESTCPLCGIYPYMVFDTEKIAEGSTGASRLARVLKFFELNEGSTAEQLARKIAERYSMTDKEGNPRFTPDEMTELVRVRYEMAVIQFSSVQQYTFLDGFSLDATGIELLTRIKEQNIHGTDINVSYSRVYHYPGYASHILGRIGKIYAENVEYYTAQGYPVTAVVGNSGCELAFEQYLRGMNGEMLITEDENGNIVSSEITKEPEAGLDIFLTIDIELQIAAEEALKENIGYVVKQSAKNPASLDGEDCECGAIVAQSVENGEVLAVASYPTFNLVTFGADYNELAADKRFPMYNRALEGTYAPGSTFKVGMAVAALTEKIRMDDGSTFNSNTIIDTKGKYTYFSDNAQTPKCWIYTASNRYRTHGKINVVTAIQVSCNYFFYEVGRMLGIDNINKYCTLYGLGQSTGIELAESKGILADEGYASARGESMGGENTIRTAIGQGFNAFTPLQINVYISTIANGGTRYAAHLLHEVRDFGSTEGKITEPEVLAKLDIAPKDLATVKEGMSKVIEGSTTVTSFVDFPLSIGGKTGTAEKDRQSNNAVFVAIAPLEDPEIAVTCVLERGAKGAYASRSVRTVMDCYFGYGNWAKTEEAPQ